ncbi:hypothetical protein C8Q75DRAFT_753594 [Abortiporus biennis]|nr:hypothetical protein C8Q75DRAFT_753594 [Abortiporus biennis]
MMASLLLTIDSLFFNPSTDSRAASLYTAFWGKGLDVLESMKPRINLALAGDFPTSEGVLYFFDQYEYMQKRVDAFRAARQHSSLIPGLALVGTPGIGKTSYLYYMLARELAQRKPAVMYSLGQLFLMNEAGVFETQLNRADSSWYRNSQFQNVLCTVDLDASDLSPALFLRETKMFLLQAASPHPSHLKWIKQRPYSRIYVFKPPTPRELVQVLSLPNEDRVYSAEDINLAIATHGYNIRVLIEFLQDGPRSIEGRVTSALTNLSIHDLRGLVNNPMAPSETSHNIIVTFPKDQPSPTSDDYLSSDTPTATIASPFVWKELLTMAAFREYEEMKALYQHLSRVPQAGTTNRWLFEAWCHHLLVRGSSLSLIPMDTKGTQLVQGPPSNATLVQLPRMAPVIFNAKKDALSTTEDIANWDEPGYYIPSAGNNPAFNSFCRLENWGIGFQMTLASTHSLDPGGIKMLYDRLSSSQQRAFIFVIPKGHSFRVTPGQRAKAWFKFYTLGLELGAQFPVVDDDVTMTDEHLRRPTCPLLIPGEYVSHYR